MQVISSASARIEASASESIGVPFASLMRDRLPAGGDNLKTVMPGTILRVPDYATVQGLLVGTVAAFVGIIVIFGPEYVRLLHLDIPFIDCSSQESWISVRNVQSGV